MKIKSVLLVALMLVSVHIVAKNDKESQASDREVCNVILLIAVNKVVAKMNDGKGL